MCLLGFTAVLEPALVKLCRYFMVCKPSFGAAKGPRHTGDFLFGLGAGAGWRVGTGYRGGS